MIKLTKRALILLLAVLMIIGVLSGGALAAETAHPHSLPFTDVGPYRWYRPYVQAAWDQGIMRGTSSTRFSPQGTFSRGQIITVLFRIYHGRSANASDSRENAFADVSVSAWHAPYVTWAYENGLSVGTSPTRFGPNDPVRRQEIATILFHYVRNLTDLDSSSHDTPEWRGFTDLAQVTNSVIYNALRWTNNHGIIRGTSTTRLSPRDTATRAEAAAMLVRFVYFVDSTEPPRPPSTALEVELEVFRLINLERAEAEEDLEPFEWHEGASIVARRFSRDMYRRNFFSHICPDRTSPIERLQAARIFPDWVGENLARGQRTPREVVDTWMDSPDHRDRILSTEFTHVGIGFYTYAWTQMFLVF